LKEPGSFEEKMRCFNHPFSARVVNDGTGGMEKEFREEKKEGLS